MNISMDYDDTYTRDPAIWDMVIHDLRRAGHTVYLVTMRHDTPSEADEVRRELKNKVDGFYFTGRKQKREFMYNHGISIDVWIDDTPDYIV